jgi:hypothetical protein
MAWRVKNMCKGEDGERRRSQIGGSLNGILESLSIAKTAANEEEKSVEFVLHIRLTLILASLRELYVFTSSQHFVISALFTTSNIFFCFSQAKSRALLLRPTVLVACTYFSLFFLFRLMHTRQRGD